MIDIVTRLRENAAEELSPRKHVEWLDAADVVEYWRSKAERLRTEGKDLASEIERLKDEHATAMSHLALALNENQRLKFRDANVRRAAREVCEVWSKWTDGFLCEIGESRNVAATVRALSDAIGR